MRNSPGDLTGDDFTTALEALASGVSIVNSKGRILYSNAAAIRILGAKPTDEPPSEWARYYGVLIPGTDTPFPESEYPLVRALRGEEPEDVEMLIRNPALSDDVIIQSSARPLREADGSIKGAVVVFRNVTALRRARDELQKANDELRETQRLKEELTAFIVHDLKSPLTSVMALASMLESSDELDPDQIREDAADISEGAARMHRMVLDLLDVQIGENGALELEREDVPVSDLLEEVADAVRSRAPGVEVQTAPEAPLRVNADRRLLFRVVTNLVDNCIKYGPAGGRISLAAAALGDALVEISVQDEGPGVPDDLRERIFDKYAQLERGRQHRSFDSRGLGLRFCRVVAEAHGGRIWVEDGEPVGARFCLLLPRPQ